MCISLLSLLFTTSFVVLVKGFPYGAPIFQCVEGFPHHGAEPQTSDPPYTLSVTPDTYSPGDVLTITLSGVNNKEFAGFALRVKREGGDPGVVYGTLNITAEEKLVQLGKFYDNVGGCATHTSNTKKKSISVEWTAPTTTVGDVIVSATVIQEKIVYWVDLNKTVTATIPGTLPDFRTQLSTQMDIPKFDLECGVSKGCFQYPIDCSGLGCRYMLSYMVDSNGDLLFEVMADTTGYVALGLSDNKDMEGTEVTICVAHENPPVKTIQRGYNPDQYYEKHSLGELKNLKVTRVSPDRLFCSFTRPVNTSLLIPVNHYVTEGPWQPFVTDLKKPYFLFIATGQTYMNTDVVKKHDSLPVISFDKINFMGTEISHGFQLPLLIKAHGILAITGWMFLAGIGIVTARHYKGALSSMCCGKACWFQMHRTFMTLVFLCSLAAVGLIFGYLQEWNKDRKVMIHGIVGLSAVGLALFQVIIAACRPHPDTPRRPCFNWTHRTAGILAFLCSAVAIFLGVYMDKVDFITQFRVTCSIAAWLLCLLILNIVLECFDHKMEAPSKDDKEGGHYGSWAYNVMWAVLIICGMSAFACTIIFLALS